MLRNGMLITLKRMRIFQLRRIGQTDIRLARKGIL